MRIVFNNIDDVISLPSEPISISSDSQGSTYPVKFICSVNILKALQNDAYTINISLSKGHIDSENFDNFSNLDDGITPVPEQLITNVLNQDSTRNTAISTANSGIVFQTSMDITSQIPNDTAAFFESNPLFTGKLFKKTIHTTVLADDIIENKSKDEINSTVIDNALDVSDDHTDQGGAGVVGLFHDPGAATSDNGVSDDNVVPGATGLEPFIPPLSTGDTAQVLTQVETNFLNVVKNANIDVSILEGSMYSLKLELFNADDKLVSYTSKNVDLSNQLDFIDSLIKAPEMSVARLDGSSRAGIAQIAFDWIDPRTRGIILSRKTFGFGSGNKSGYKQIRTIDAFNKKQVIINDEPGITKTGYRATAMSKRGNTSKEFAGKIIPMYIDPDSEKMVDYFLDRVIFQIASAVVDDSISIRASFHDNFSRGCNIRFQKAVDEEIKSRDSFRSISDYYLVGNSVILFNDLNLKHGKKYSYSVEITTPQGSSYLLPETTSIIKFEKKIVIPDDIDDIKLHVTDQSAVSNQSTWHVRLGVEVKFMNKDVDLYSEFISSKPQDFSKFFKQKIDVLKQSKKKILIHEIIHKYQSTGLGEVEESLGFLFGKAFKIDNTVMMPPASNGPPSADSNYEIEVQSYVRNVRDLFLTDDFKHVKWSDTYENIETLEKILGESTVSSGPASTRLTKKFSPPPKPKCKVTSIEIQTSIWTGRYFKAKVNFSTYPTDVDYVDIRVFYSPPYRFHILKHAEINKKYKSVTSYTTNALTMPGYQVGGYMRMLGRIRYNDGSWGKGFITKEKFQFSEDRNAAPGH